MADSGGRGATEMRGRGSEPGRSGINVISVQCGVDPCEK